MLFRFGMILQALFKSYKTKNPRIAGILNIVSLQGY